jgi:hypothetical protein
VSAVPDTDRQTQRESPESAVAEIESAPALRPVRIGARRDVRALTAGALLCPQRSAGNQAVMRAMARPQVARVPADFAGLRTSQPVKASGTTIVAVEPA